MQSSDIQQYTNMLDRLAQPPQWTTANEAALTEPFAYITATPGKEIRARMIAAFDAWLRVPPEKLEVIGKVVNMLHSASLLVDDIEDDSQLRRGSPGMMYCAQDIRRSADDQLRELCLLPGVCGAVSTARFVDVRCRQDCDRRAPQFTPGTRSGALMARFITMPNRGRIYRHETGGLFRIATKLMMICATTNREIDYVPLVNLIGVFFQIRDDYFNLQSKEYETNKGFAEDLTEGKFSFPVVHGIRADRSNRQVLNVLQKRPTTPTLKHFTINYLAKHTKSFDYTLSVLESLETQIRDEIVRLGSNEAAPAGKMSRPSAQSSSAGTWPRSLRIVASGTLFLTHVLTLPSFPGEAAVARARSVASSRGGSAANVLAALGQFTGVMALLVAPLAGNSEGKALARDLQRERVDTRMCRLWDGAGVPSAWVIESDITHEEFVSLLGPLLVPENYEYMNSQGGPSSPAGMPSSRPQSGGNSPNPQNQSPAPFEWLHFEGRSIKTTLSNIIGIDGLARERKWRSHCVFSLDVCKVRQGVEALIPHADVIFFSVPTREYLQSSGWVDDDPALQAMRPLSTVTASDSSGDAPGADPRAVGSVRSGSGFWAAGHRTGSGTSSSAFTASSGLGSGPQSSGLRDSSGYMYGDFGALGGMSDIPEHVALEDADVDHDSQGTEVGNGHKQETGSAKERKRAKKDMHDEAAAQDAFIAGMIYSLGQRILPGSPYTPSAASYSQAYGSNNLDFDRGRWKLEDCLRFASEFAGRRARRRDFVGLAEEMRRAGWLD
ncbi:hypothetical protein EW145_g1870 [Phellinidium pouzarii]|uniref:(2E,6E)-farnesyl diphosphate synthase n=1 Tax=Phellinidium pouzarii TaxID=167371 RepID=A0A4S4LEL8_9AGAM|nr:hypothetical protein EW145_g1870 [Phellinidium pouzarii]